MSRMWWRSSGCGIAKSACSARHGVGPDAVGFVELFHIEDVEPDFRAARGSVPVGVAITITDGLAAGIDALEVPGHRFFHRHHPPRRADRPAGGDVEVRSERR